MESSRKEYYESYGRRQIIRELPPDAPLLFHERLRLNRLIRYLPAGRFQVLDCGCGDGALSLLAAEKGAKVIALDLSLERLKKLSSQVDEKPIRQLAGDCCALPLKKESVDVVLVSELLEHVPEDDTMLEEIWKALKKGGKFILSVPYREMINTVVCPNCHFEFFRHGHLRSYDKSLLKNQLVKAGFTKIRLTFSNNLKTRFIRGRSFFPIGWLVSLDTFFSALFPNQSRFLIAVAEKT